jgi:hypothetical protein
MLGKVVGLNFMDHDITDEKKFLDLARENYLHTRSVPRTGEIMLETHEWVIGLEKAGILNLLEIPHFGRCLEINVCEGVSQLFPWRDTMTISPNID